MASSLIKKFSFDNLPSTTKKASELLGKGEKTPFYITAKTQNQGRGTYSTKWLSPYGGIYLQAVYPFPQDKQSSLTQRLAFVLAKWVFKLAGKKITIKWPNDLFWEGRKLAGVLCEKHTIQQKSYLSVGIGINVELAPSSPSIPYHTTCLKDILKEIPILEELKISLITFLHKNFYLHPEEPSSEDFSLFFMPPNTIWYQKGDPSSWLRYEGLTSEGFLRLKDKNGKVITLNSVKSPFSWYFIDTKKEVKPILKLEHRKEETKLLFFLDFRQEKPQKTWSFPYKEQKNDYEEEIKALQEKEGLIEIPTLL